MPSMTIKKLNLLKKLKESMTMEQKKLILGILKNVKEEYTGNVGGETDITYADNLVSEDEFTAAIKPERNVIAKTFDTHADYDSYVNQRRGIEMTPKEQQAVLGFKKANPTQQDKFFIKYETTDAFGQNNTTTIKKLKEGNQFCWTAFSKYETAEEEGNPEDDETEIKPPEHKDIEKEKELGEPSQDMGKGENPEKIRGKEKKLPLKELVPTSPSANPSIPSNQAGTSQIAPEDEEEVTVDDPIRITKTITFINDNDGSNILADLLNSGKLDL